MIRRALLVLAVTGLAVGLTACGVSNSIDPVAAAATKSQSAGGFKTSLKLSMTANGRRLTMTGHGTFGDKQGELDLDMPDLLGQLGAPSGMDMTMKALYLTEDGDPVMYMQLGLLAGQLPGGKTWVRIDLAKAGKAAGIDLGQLMGGAGQNPSDWLALLRANGEFSEVGHEAVGGADTTHYHGTVDLQKAAGGDGPAAPAIKRLLDLGAPTTYPLDVWVDDAGYIRQFELSYDETLSGNTVSMSMTMSMSDYGTAVDVSAPPADQVFDATNLAAQGAASALNGTTH
jgi:hypothetical protein